MSSRKSYVYKGFERFWHWTQALLILFLALTGFEVHGSIRLLGYREAVRYHSAAAIGLLVLIVFAVFWHFTTGEWRQYVPTRRFLRAQVDYYLSGIFKGAPHPTKKTLLSKLNPLQKLVYLALKLLVIPVMVVSGLLYMFHRYPLSHAGAAFGTGGLEAIALVHTAGAFILVAFVIGHIYLTTTGRTLFSNLKAMMTGYEELDGPKEAPASSIPASIDEALRGEA
ncbi:MAG: cytochrome b/b6 domain-containing protein [Acidobacteria bacterium]|nr:cytochrome b/b6 domain-containing protein [Acidobacteriota bacterium]